MLVDFLIKKSTKNAQRTSVVRVSKKDGTYRGVCCVSATTIAEAPTRQEVLNKLTELGYQPY